MRVTRHGHKFAASYWWHYLDFTCLKCGCQFQPEPGDPFNPSIYGVIVPCPECSADVQMHRETLRIIPARLGARP